MPHITITVVDIEYDDTAVMAYCIGWPARWCSGRASDFDREIASLTPAGALPGSLGQLSLPSLRSS